jgi:hypothetical protein
MLLQPNSDLECVTTASGACRDDREASAKRRRLSCELPFRFFAVKFKLPYSTVSWRCTSSSRVASNIIIISRHTTKPFSSVRELHGDFVPSSSGCLCCHLKKTS